MRQDKGDSGVEPAISNTSLPSFIIGGPDTSICINPLDCVSKRHSLDLVGLKPRVIQRRVLGLGVILSQQMRQILQVIYFLFGRDTSTYHKDRYYQF